MGKGLKQKRITADGIILARGPGWLRKLIISTNNSAIGEVLIYDNASAASGTVVCRSTGPKSSTTDTFGVSTQVDFPGAGAWFENGLYGDISGGTTAVQCYWDE